MKAFELIKGYWAPEQSFSFKCAAAPIRCAEAMVLEWMAEPRVGVLMDLGRIRSRLPAILAATDAPTAAPAPTTAATGAASSGTWASRWAAYRRAVSFAAFLVLVARCPRVVNLKRVSMCKNSSAYSAILANLGAGRQAENDCLASVLVQVLGLKENADLQEGFGFFVQHLLSGGLEKAHAERRGKGGAGRKAGEKAQGRGKGKSLMEGADNGAAAGDGGREGKNGQWRENLKGPVWEGYVDGMAWILQHGGGEGREFRCSHCSEGGSSSSGGSVTSVQANDILKGMYVSGVGATEFALAFATELSKPENCADAGMYIFDGNNANKCIHCMRGYTYFIPSIALIVKFAYRPFDVLFNRFVSVFPPHSSGFSSLLQFMRLPPLPPRPSAQINLARMRGEIEELRIPFLLLVAFMWPASILDMEQFESKRESEGDGLRVKTKVETGRKKGKARRGMGREGEEEGVEEEEDDGEVWEELQSWCFAATVAWPSSLRVMFSNPDVESAGSGLSDVCMGSEGRQKRMDVKKRVAKMFRSLEGKGLMKRVQRQGGAAESSSTSSSSSTDVVLGSYVAKYALGNPKLCKFCGFKFEGGTARCAVHLAKWKGQDGRPVRLCKDVSPKVREEVRAMYENKEENKSMKRGAAAAALDSVLGAVTACAEKKGKITELFGDEATCAKEDADNALCLMISALKLPERIVDDPVFRYAVQCFARAGPGYVPPKRGYVGGAGLKKVRQKMEAALAPVAASWKRDGVTVSSDMMTDRCGRPQANILLVNDSGAVFEQAVDCNMESKTGGYIASLLRPVIDKVGPENVVAVCTDGGSNYASAARKIAGTWPHIEHVPCATHVLDLLMEDVGKMGWAKGLVEKGGEMITFVRNHHFTRAYMKKVGGKQVLKPAGTRFGTQYIAMARLCEVRSGLAAMVLSDEWKVWAAGDKDRKTAAEKFRAAVMDEEWWGVAEFFSSLMAVPFKAMRATDSSAKGMMDKLHDIMLQLTEDINDKLDASGDFLTRTERADITKIVKDRWDNSLACPMHVVGRILNPANQEEGIFRNDVECTRVFKDYIERHYDHVTFRRGKDGAPRRASLVLQEALLAYINLEGSFGKLSAIAAREAVKKGEMSMVQWWSWHSTEYPELATLACRILTQPVSASSCERGWAQWEDVHTARRNRLGSAKCADLVYIAHNWNVVRNWYNKDGASTVVPGNIPDAPIPRGYNMDEEEEDDLLGGEGDDAVLADDAGGAGAGASAGGAGAGASAGGAGAGASAGGAGAGASAVASGGGAGVGDGDSDGVVVVTGGGDDGARGAGDGAGAAAGAAGDGGKCIGKKRKKGELPAHLKPWPGGVNLVACLREMLLGEPCYRPSSPAAPSAAPTVVNTTASAPSTASSASSTPAAATNAVAPSASAATGTAAAAAPVEDAEASGPDACRESRCGAAGCGRVEGGGGVKLRSCGGCGKVAYCSRECQKAHWPSHKLTCPGRTSGRGGGSSSGKVGDKIVG
ncbi:unnamed protein product [Closterium sp. Naga37s-1]|nr:unnamed protein product [Closterium sp. Naga37s-1]